jgi:Zn-dependent protease with chaperone function
MSSYLRDTTLVGLGSLAVGGLLIYATNWLALRPWRKARADHWTEQARLLFPVRSSAATNVWLVSPALALFWFVGNPELRNGWPLVAVSAWCGGFLANYFLLHEYKPMVRFLDWLRDSFMTVVIRLFQFGPYLAAAWLMPPEVEWRTWVLAGLVLGIHSWLLFSGTIRLLRWTGLIRPASRRLQQIVDDVTARAKCKVARVWEAPGLVANALALPHTGELIFTDRLLAILSDEEIAAVTAHEVGHLTESRAVIATRLFGTLICFPLIFVRPLWHLHQPALFLALPIGVLLLSHWLNVLGRKMEVRADGIARQDLVDPGVYASALEKLYQEDLIPAVMEGKRQIHPHLYDRLLAAGVTPGYARPKPARAFGRSTLFFCFGGSLGFFLLVFTHAIEW